jgi:hypothetical protein
VLVHRGLRRLEQMLAADGDGAVTRTEHQTINGSR